MSEFLNEYFNIRKMIREKKEYKRQMARVNTMPEEYKFVFKKIQSHMWMFTSGAGYDMMKIHNELVELFEEGIADGRRVLDITGEDVAAFCEELLKSCKTYTENWREKLNREIKEKIGDK